MADIKDSRRQPHKRMPLHHGGFPDPEVNSGIPKEMPIGACRPRSLQEIIATMVFNEVQAREKPEAESWDEANDFDLPDDLDSQLDFSPYELKELTEEEPLVPDPTPPVEANGPENGSQAVSGSSGEDSGEPTEAPE